MKNTTIQGYIILTSYGANDLQNDVMQKIKEGYVPCGGVSVTDDHGFTFAQALIKYAQD